jgi:hypothetical protein
MNLFATGWPWYISGPLIFVTMALLVLLSRRFGVSSNLESICALAGAGRVAPHFRGAWRGNAWNLAFIAGAMTGGLLTHVLGAAGRMVPISSRTVTTLASWGFSHDPGFAPASLMGRAALSSPTAWGLLGRVRRAARPRASTSSPRATGEASLAPETKSSSRRWSTIQTSCPGRCCARNAGPS